MVVGGPNGMVIPGAMTSVGWTTVSVGAPGGGPCGSSGAGGLITGACGTPAYPPMAVGLGNYSLSVPFSAPSIVDFQMSDGSPEPYTGPPPLFTRGCVPAVVPTHTAVDSDGV